MISSIKKKIIKFVDSRLDLLAIKQQTHFDYQYISQLFKGDIFVPLTKFSLSPTSISHILNEILFHDRKRILEFGSGASTLYIAKLIKQMGLETVFYSVESSREWAIEMRRQIRLCELEQFVKIIEAPIVPVLSKYSFKKQVTWYDADCLHSLLNNSTKFDLVIIDGPVGNSTPFARYSAVPFLQQKLSGNFIIFLDDADRFEEEQILQEWQNVLKCNINKYGRYATLSHNPKYEVKPFQIQ